MNVLLFDFGGTIDTNGVHWSEKFWEVYQRCGVEITKDQFQAAYRTAEPRMTGEIIKPTDTLQTTLSTQIALQLRALSEQGVRTDASSSDLTTRLAGECYRDVCRTVEQVCPLLEFLQTKYRLGLVSNFYGNLQSVTEELAIDSYFDVRVDSAVVGVEKPDPEIFRLALRMLDCDATKAAVIGDSYERDVVPAKLIGCKTIWVDGKSWRRPERTDQADIIIHQLQELPTVVGDLSN